jgi:hypothetical protein
VNDLADWLAEIREGLAKDPANVIAAHGMIPLDPLDEDRIPPPDLHVCPTCKGRGEVYTRAGTPFEEFHGCVTCGGSGEV